MSYFSYSHFSILPPKNKKLMVFLFYLQTGYFGETGKLTRLGHGLIELSNLVLIWVMAGQIFTNLKFNMELR
jgi:hypothetical protein